MGLTSAFLLCFLTCLCCVSIVILKNTHEPTHIHTLSLRVREGVPKWISMCTYVRTLCRLRGQLVREFCSFLHPCFGNWTQTWWQVPVPSLQLIGSPSLVGFCCGDHTCIICFSSLIISLCLLLSLIIPYLPFVPFSCPLDLAVFNT